MLVTLHTQDGTPAFFTVFMGVLFEYNMTRYNKFYILLDLNDLYIDYGIISFSWVFGLKYAAILL